MQNSASPQNVVLESASPEESGDIVMHGGLVAVGRYEPPFSESQSAAGARMSRRHARVFQESGNVFIVDLGSSNGTTVNGATIGRQPVRLFNGDEVIFAGCFKYTLKIPEQLAAAPTTLNTPALELTLKPQTGDLDTIVVSRFSFLVSKNSDLFAPYRDTHAREIGFLSRRHAHVYEQEGDLYIEDLGSTNGTYVNGERLDEHARKLQDGDTIGFGGEFFVYQVSLRNSVQSVESEAPATQLPTSTHPPGTDNPQPTERDAEAKTTFVSTASSFLDIFYDQQDDNADPHGVAERKGERAQAAGGSARSPAGRVSFLGRMNASIDELRGGDAASAAGGRRWKPLAALGVVAVALLGAWLYFAGTSVDHIRELVSAKDYAAAAAQADSYLGRHPEDSEVRRLASKALLNTVIPDWTGLVDAGQYDDAHALLTDAGSLTGHNPDGQAMLALLAWMTDLDRYHTRQENSPGAVTIFEDEIKIGELIAQWESDPDGHRLLLSRMIQLAPALEPGRVRASSQLTGLYGDRSGFLQVIDELKTSIMTRLATGRDDEVKDLISTFEAKYPSIIGIGILHEDRAAYAARRKALDEKDVAALWQLTRAGGFSTPLFRDAADRYLKPDMPPSEILEQYDAARMAWRNGDVDSSLQILDSLSGKTWGEVAKRLMQEQTQVLTAFNALGRARATATYDEQMLALHALLKPDRDSYYAQKTAADFETLRAGIVKAAESDYAEAQREWATYQEQGGITGLMRLEDPVSNDYRELASTLSRSHTESQNALAAYRSVTTDPPAETLAFGSRVTDEILRQRAWLQELDVILPPSLLQQKLALLPQL